MRRDRTEIRIVIWTLISAVLVVVMAYLWTNQGQIRSMLAASEPGRAQSGSLSQTVTPAAAEGTAHIEASSQGEISAQEEALPQGASSPQTITSASVESQSKNQEAVPNPLNTKIVAVGDSFTYGNPVGPEKSWTKWAADRLGVIVVNHGRVGQVARDVLAHFDEDVLLEKPGRVVIFVGNGDAIKGVTLEDYQRSVKTMVTKARENQIIPIVALPLPYRGFDQRIKGMRDWLSRYAETEKIQSLDFAAVLFDSHGKYLKGMSADGKYPTLGGYQAMGEYAQQVLSLH